MKLTPYVIGSGRAAQAIREAWAILPIARPGFTVERPVLLRRDQAISKLPLAGDNPVLCIANPPGLHANCIRDGAKAGFRLIIVEKPACISVNEVKALASIRIPVAVCHVYRQMWGIQTLKKMIGAGEFGSLISIEGRYWQSSTAQRAAGERTGGGWKNDPKLSGPSDTLLDVGVHWADAAAFLAGSAPVKTSLWRSYANAEARHRDSHVHLRMEFRNGLVALSSISKTMHGAPNHFEINLVGAKKSATWKFLEPDQIEIGAGSSRALLIRKDDIASRHPAFHGLGWVDGYVALLRDAAASLDGGQSSSFPTLQEHLSLIKALLSAKRM